MAYSIQLVEEKVKQQQVTALHLISALSFLGAGAVIYVYNAAITYWGLALLIAAIGLLAATIGMNKKITRPAANTVVRIIELLIAIALFSYSALQQWRFPMGIYGVLSVVLIFSLFWERKANSKQYVTVDEHGIQLPGSLRSKAMEWTGVEDVLLRFGVLSISTTDNHRYQWNVHKPEFDAAIFEQYCKTLVDNSRDRRSKDDW